MKRKSRLEILFMVLLVLFAVMSLLPFLLVIGSSLTDEQTLLWEGYNFIPKKFSTAAYQFVLKGNIIPNAYKVTLFVAVVGTILSLFITSGLAYGMVCKRVVYRREISLFVYLTMLFSGGLVPTYLLISRYLHLNNSIWVLILPALVNPWNVFLLRNFFAGIPDSILEAARIDGSNEISTLFRIVLPISKPGIATISLYYALAYWNEWFRAMLFITKKTLYPLQYLIVTLIRNLDAIAADAREANISMGTMIPSNSVRLATVVVTIGPIIFLYPFIQKYFVKGITVGSVKG